MRTAQHGNGSSTLFALPVANAPREEVVRTVAAPPRSPSNTVSPVRPPARVVEEVDEVLIEDVRAGVTPAEMVEQKLRSLLRTRGISLELAGRIAEKSPLTLKLLKRSMRQGLDMPLGAALHYEQAMVSLAFDTQDVQEGTAAFLEKRTPQFTGD